MKILVTKPGKLLLRLKFFRTEKVKKSFWCDEKFPEKSRTMPKKPKGTLISSF